MPDTIRTKAQILSLMPDNTVGAISPQDMRDFVVSIYDSVSAPEIKTITGDTTAASSDRVILVDASIASVTLTLPAASGRTTEFHVKRIGTGSNGVTVMAAGSDLIENSTSVSLVSLNAVTIVSDLSNWWII